MGILRNVARRIRGYNCEQIIRKIGNEISLSGAAIDGGSAKINIGMFSNKIVELVKASDTAVNLDQAQYLICKAKHDSEDQEFRTRCERIQLQIVLALTQLRNIFETIKVDPNPEMRNELVDWIRYCGSLNKHAIETLKPGSTTMGSDDYEIQDIMKYQDITEEDMQEALKELK